jgi:hypothetical protein
MKSNAKISGDRITRRIRWIARIWGAVVLVITLLILSGYVWNWATTGRADPCAAEDYPPSALWRMGGNRHSRRAVSTILVALEKASTVYPISHYDYVSAGQRDDVERSTTLKILELI